MLYKMTPPIMSHLFGIGEYQQEFVQPHLPKTSLVINCYNFFPCWTFTRRSLGYISTHFHAPEQKTLNSEENCRECREEYQWTESPTNFIVYRIPCKHLTQDFIVHIKYFSCFYFSAYSRAKISKTRKPWESRSDQRSARSCLIVSSFIFKFYDTIYPYHEILYTREKATFIGIFHF